MEKTMNVSRRDVDDEVMKIHRDIFHQQDNLLINIEDALLV